jgi:membrane protein DedA with SNARE-associated domain
MEWFKELLNLATQSVGQSSPAGLIAMFLVAMLTEIGLPFPFVVDGVLFLSGYQSGLISMHVLYVIVALTLGREVGASIIYWLSRLVGGAFTRWLGRRYPRWNERLNWLGRKMSRRAIIAVTVARLTPGLLTASTVAAGCVRLGYYQLLLGIIAASLVTDVALVLIGFATNHGLTVLGVKPAPWQGIVAFLIVFLVIFLVQRYWPRKRLKSS